MLIKDNIKVEKLEHKTKNISVNIALNFTLNNKETNLDICYIPDKFKIIQTSIKEYLNILSESKTFDLENISAIITEDLFDLAVPKDIKITISQTIEDIKTSISTQKSQPKFKR